MINNLKVLLYKIIVIMIIIIDKDLFSIFNKDFVKNHDVSIIQSSHQFQQQ